MRKMSKEPKKNYLEDIPLPKSQIEKSEILQNEMKRVLQKNMMPKNAY